MKLRTVGAAAAALSLLFAAAPASAAIYTITYNGTVTSGFDVDVFGVGGSLANQAFTAKFAVDTATAGTVVDETSVYSILFGNFGVSPVSAELTINGVTEILGNWSGQVYEEDQPGSSYDELRHFAAHQTYTESVDLFGYNTDLRIESLNVGVGSTVSDLTDRDFRTAPVSYVLGGSDTSFGAFSFYRSTETSSGGFFDGITAQGNLNVTSFTVAGVPEPATWVMMILGFGAAGALLRRRRTVLA